MTIRRLIFAAAVLGVGFSCGLVIAGRLSLTEPSWAKPTLQTAARPTAATMASPLPDLSTVAERALKVAANVTSTAVVAVNDPMTRFLYGGNVSQRSQSLGSGVVVDPSGIILTNSHVIQNSRASISVMLPDGREVPGKILGVDPISDLAVLKVEATNLDTLPWGDSSKLRVAEWVLAIGNPFQLSGTVTLGIVSTVNRSGEQMGSASDFIQTDAAINSGNSGGALVNARGELIGINTMILASEGGGNQGIGFAIPSNTAQRIMKELIDHGEVPWGSIGGVQWYPIDERTARNYGLGDRAGVVVNRIAQDSSAYRAGLRASDLVVSINGQPMVDATAIGRAIILAPIGGKLSFGIERQGRAMTIDVPVVKR